MTSLGDVVCESLQVNGHLTVRGGSDDEHVLSNNGSIVYFKHATRLTIASIATTSGSNLVTVTTVQNSGINTSASNNHRVSLVGFTPDDYQGIPVAELTGDVTVNNSGTQAVKAFQIQVASNATATGIQTATGTVVVRTYKYLDLTGPSTTWQLARHTSPGSA